MIQDALKLAVTRTETKFKDLFCISNEQGQVLIDDNGRALILPLSQNLFTLKFKYSTPQEWFNELYSIGQVDANDRFPFVYVNSMAVSEPQDARNPIVEIGEIVLAINSLPSWTSAERDTYSFKPILNNLCRLFYEALEASTDFSVISRGTRKVHYFYGSQGLYGGKENKFKDFTDAIELNNIKLRIYNNC